MELIKTLSKAVSDAVDYTVRKTGEMTDIARLKLRRTKVAEEVNEAYTEIGRLVYRQWRDDTDDAERIAALCLTIEKGHAEMKRIAESIEGIKLLSKMETEARAEAKAAEAKEAQAEAEDEMCEEIFDTDEILF